MARVLLLAGCVGFASALAAGLMLSQSPANRHTSVLQADRTGAILKPAPPGTHASARFTLRNLGDTPLLLSEPQATCGCVEATLTEEKIPPGGEVELHVVIRVPQVGKRRETVTVFSDSPVTKSITVAITAVSDTPPPYVIPGAATVVFRGWLEPGAERIATIDTVEPNGEEPWLKSFQSDLAFVTPDLAEVVEQPAEEGFVRRRYRIKLRLESVPSVGETSGKLQIISARPISNAAFLEDFSVSQHFQGVPILIDVPPPVEAHPKSLFAITATSSQGMLVSLRAAQPGFALSAWPVEPVPGWIRVNPADSPIEGMQTFRVQIAEPMAGESPETPVVRSEIHFETNHPAMPEVTVPVLYRRTNSAGG